MPGNSESASSENAPNGDRDLAPTPSPNEAEALSLQPDAVVLAPISTAGPSQSDAAQLAEPEAEERSFEIAALIEELRREQKEGGSSLLREFLDGDVEVFLSDEAHASLRGRRSNDMVAYDHPNQRYVVRRKPPSVGRKVVLAAVAFVTRPRTLLPVISLVVAALLAELGSIGKGEAVAVFFKRQGEYLEQGSVPRFFMELASVYFEKGSWSVVAVESFVLALLLAQYRSDGARRTAP